MYNGKQQFDHDSFAAELAVDAKNGIKIEPEMLDFQHEG